MTQHTIHTNEQTNIHTRAHRLEEVLSTRRYLAGDRVTLSDVRVFPSLARFDEVYNVYFKCNKKRLVDFPNILNYLRDLYQTYPEGFASTTEMDHIRVRTIFSVQQDPASIDSEAVGCKGCSTINSLYYSVSF